MRSKKSCNFAFGNRTGHSSKAPPNNQMGNTDSLQTIINLVRKQAFARRNGIVADALRRHGTPHRYIMGCQLTELMEIARTLPHNAEVAQTLWADREHRECRLLAIMVIPPEEVTPNLADEWSEQVRCEEEADVLCHRLLRRWVGAKHFLEARMHHEPADDLSRYVTMRLMLNLILQGTEPQNDWGTWFASQAMHDKYPSLVESLKEELNNTHTSS